MEQLDGNNLLIKIMDAESVHEKLRLLEDNRENLDARTLGNLAVVFDIVPDTDNCEELFVQIAQYLRTRAHFEPDRFR